MMKKTLVAGLIFISLIAVSMNFASAVFSETIEDDFGDVINVDSEENVSGMEYIDIKEVTCSRDYRRVTLTLEVFGDIRDEGSINIWRIMFDDEYLEQLIGDAEDEEEAAAIIEEIYTSHDTLVSYIFYIETSEDFYMIVYVNQECLIISEENKLIDSTLSVNDDTLTITYNLLSSKENLTTAIVEAQEMQISLLEETGYSDDVLVELDDQSPTGGDDDVDENDDGESDSGITVFILMIVIIIIAVVAVVVFFVRR
jgi:hypothetical protein